MIKFITRTAARLRPRKWSYGRSSGRDGIVVHYLGGGKWRGWGGSPAAMWREVQKWHQDERGWNDVAYSLASADHDGGAVVVEGRSGPTYGWRNRTAATGHKNPTTFAVCALIGGADGKPTEAELDATADAVRRLRANTRCSHKLSGHRDHMDTQCPGDPLYARIPEIGRRADGVAPDPDPKPKPGPKPRPGRDWRVLPGNTLSWIAKHWGVSVKDIQRYNDIPDPDLIRVGQKIRFPAKPEPDPGRLPSKQGWYPWHPKVESDLGAGCGTASPGTAGRLGSTSRCCRR